MIRPAAPSDRQFVVSTWSRSFKLMHSAGLISDEDWPTVMRPQFEKILDRDGVRTMIACGARDPDFFYGWIAADPLERVLVYVYVKEPYRRTGIARQLFAAIGIDPSRPFVYVCRGPSFTALAGKATSARYNPNCVRFPKEQR